MAETQIVTDISGAENIPPKIRKLKPSRKAAKRRNAGGKHEGVNSPRRSVRILRATEAVRRRLVNLHSIYMYRQYPITDRRHPGNFCRLRNSRSRSTRISS